MSYPNPAMFFYMAAFLFLVVYYYADHRYIRYAHTVSLMAGLGLNAVYLLHTAFTPAHMTQAFFMLLSFTLGIIYLVWYLKNIRFFMGLFILPGMIGAGLFSLFIGGGPAKSRAMESLWLYMHIPLSVAGMAFFLTAFAVGIMYFLLEKELKSKRLGRIFKRFPTLSALKHISGVSMHLGFAFFSAGMLGAAAWMLLRYDSVEPFAPSFYVKILLCAVVWLNARLVILVNRLFAFTAREMAFISFGGLTGASMSFAAIVLAMFRI